MKKMKFSMLLLLVGLLVMLLPFAVSAETPENGWYKDGDDWKYFRNGEQVVGEVLNLGGTKYFIDWDGTMLDNNEEAYLDDAVYRARPGGVLYVNSWYYDEYGDGYYYDAQGMRVHGFYQVGGKTYYFDPWVIKDQAIFDYANEKWYILSEDGTSSKLLTKGWNQAFGAWYYLKEDGLAQEELLTIGGVKYYFTWEGKMVADGIYDFYTENGDYVTGYFDSNGALLDGKWGKDGSDWIYAFPGGELAFDGVYEIGGQLYFFDWYRMYSLPGELWDTYYVSASGALYRNKWYKDLTGDRFSGTGWAYYDENGERTYGLKQIGSKLYYFGDYGIMETNTVVEDYTYGVYVADKDGVLTKVDGWFTAPNGDQYYARNGRLPGGPVEVDGVMYCMAGGRLLKNFYYYDDVRGYFMGDANGKLITKQGWHKIDGYWYYVKDAEGHLAYGVTTIGKNTYCLYPEMQTNSICHDYEGQEVYVVDANGLCTKVSGNGFVNVGGRTCYIENKQMLKDQWKQVGGKWYYFDEAGIMITGDYRDINGKTYVFDQDGVMASNTWYEVYGINFYLSSSGAAVTGYQTIGGVGYLFDYDGWLIYEECWQKVDGVYYFIENGRVTVKISKQGWTQVGSDWYYVDETGYLYRDDLLMENGVVYGFDYNGKMVKNGIYYIMHDAFLFDANGKALKGWQKVDGAWVYAMTEGYPWLVQNGVEWINGKNYIFKDCKMQTGTVVMYDTIYTTDANGAVIKETPLPDGWTYVDGTVLYIKDGRYYTGWVGEYYIYDGEMRFNTVIEYDGRYYFLLPDGRYMKNASYNVPLQYYANPYVDYEEVRAKADGTLYCNEWYQANGNWYYYSWIYKVVDDYVEIDGQLHSFDNTGKWQGQPKYSPSPENKNLSDGWHQISGKWYYYESGEPYVGYRYINGAYYYFDDSTGAMITNSFDDYGYAYFGADGRMAEYTGWKQIKGEWYYFTASHTVWQGLVRSGNGWYYCTDLDNDGLERSAMVKNVYLIIGRELYYFNASGYSTGAVTKDGWYQSLGEWVYVKNGALVYDGVYQIGKDYYLFSCGYMMSDCYSYVDYYAGGARYFGADGRMITKAGWHETKYGWIYIDKDGYLYDYGVYKIGGVQYSFYEGYWIK